MKTKWLFPEQLFPYTKWTVIQPYTCQSSCYNVANTNCREMSWHVLSHKTHTSYIDTENGATYRRNQNFRKSRQVPSTSEKSDSLGWSSKKSYFPPEASAHDPVTPHQLSKAIPDKPSLITVTSDKNDISVPEKSVSPAPLWVSSRSNKEWDMVLKYNELSIMSCCQSRQNWQNWQEL